MIEHREGVSFRVSGRVLSGRALVYGDISPDFNERFLPGAFGEVRTVPVNLQHDPRLVVSEAATLIDSTRSLDVRADLPDGSAALALVRRGALTGFSIEFHANAERREAGVRVVERAELTGLALVDRGAYPQSTVEIRARSGRTIRAIIPSDTAMDCECVGIGCKVKFLQEALASAIEEGIESGTRAVIAAHGDFKNPLGSTTRGTVRGRMVGGDAEIEFDLPDSDVGRQVLAAADDSGVVVRPSIDRTAAEFTTDADGTTTYTKSPIRAFIVSATDKREGWPDPIMVPTPAHVMAEALSKIHRRRRLWL